MQRPPSFTIQALDIDPETGKIISGRGFIESTQAAVVFKSTATQDDDNDYSVQGGLEGLFASEKRFSMDLVAQSDGQTIKAKFEGFYQTDLLNT